MKATQDPPTLVVALVSSPVERELIRDFVSSGPLAGAEVIEVPSRSGSPKGREALAAKLSDRDWRLVPLRVLWLPSERDGKRRASLVDLARGRNPYHPAPRHQRQILAREPDRAQVMVGADAPSTLVRTRWEETTHEQNDAAFAAYTVRRAQLALERAEGAVLGPQYKSPRLVKEEVLNSRRFQEGIAELRRRLGADRVSYEAVEEMLDEMATGWGRLFADIFPITGRRIFERGFDPVIDRDPKQIDRLRDTMQRLPTILLWSHRSNMDNPVLTLVMHEEGLPKAYTFGGINMAFGPMGPILRRAGMIFIRRDIGGDPVYKYVLREYVGYLVEKRFNLSWSIEGTRSRTGKMLPPKLGLLGYVADAYLDGRSEDIALQPVSITFDQLYEIGEYADYAAGGSKRPESMQWLVGFIRDQGSRYFGKAHIRFPEPVSMRAVLGPPNGPISEDPDARRLALQKLAFEVAWRINWASPVTPTALVTSLLLGTRGAGLTVELVHLALQSALDHLEQMEVPLTDSVAGLRTMDGVRTSLDALTQGGPVTVVTDGRVPVYLIEPKNQLAATFYRNSIIHVFLHTALCEIAVLRAGDAADRGKDAEEEFWSSVLRLRDLLKFEFYFEERSRFKERIAAEMARSGPDWAERLGRGRAEAESILRGRLPLATPFTLRTFFESYALVLDVLVHQDHVPDRAEVVREALGLGRQYVAQGVIRSREPVSALVFDTGLKLAESQGLLEESDDRIRRTRALYRELRTVLTRIQEVESIATRVLVIQYRERAGLD